MQFRGTDGSEITTKDIDLILPDNDKIPDIINQPVINVSSNDDIIALRLESVAPSSTFPASSSTKEYVIAVQGSTQAWAVGAAETLYQWLKRRRTPLFRFYMVILFALLAIGALGLVAAFFQLHLSKDGNTITLKSPFFFPFMIGGLASIVAAFNFAGTNSSFSITVRDRPNYFSLGNIAFLVTIVSGIFSMFRSFFGPK